MKWFLLLILFSLSSYALAFENEEKLAEPKNEARAEELFKEIRCLVCKGESLSESNADLAVDMRRLIRNKISNGESEDEIKDYLVFRYGPGILQKPPFTPATYLLWLTPIALLIIGAISILHLLFSRKLWRHKHQM